MRKTLLTLTSGLFCIVGLMNGARADYTSSAGNTLPPPAPPSVISNSYEISPAPPSTTVSSRHRHHRSSTVYSSATPAVYSNQHSTQPFWIAMHSGEPLPTNAVVGGSQYNPNAMFYVCRANYRGGVHPGKFLAGNCNISWGGREVMMQNYEILVSETPLAWIEGSHGSIPRHAVQGGRENHHKLYVCQAEYGNGTHPGKIVGKNCNFSWGGHEMMTPFYSVLTS